jgi:hypothetical protein
MILLLHFLYFLLFYTYCWEGDSFSAFQTKGLWFWVIQNSWLYFIITYVHDYV